MFELPPALQGFAAYRQFCAWKSVQFPGEPKPRKLPLSHVDGKAFDHTDISSLTDFTTAAESVSKYNLGGIAFVFKDTDPFFFLDIDNCLVNGQWSNTALGLLQTFNGAAVEVSQSGQGLHVFGRYNQIPDHAKKNSELGLELYHNDRFVALTCRQTLGDVNTDWTNVLPNVIDAYFKPKSIDYHDWTTEPCDGWSGPDDDMVLVTKAMSSMSAATVIGTRASFKDLFTADETVLSRIYPDRFGGGRSFDGSEVDAALACHLAFWTGRNCERIERIMRMSKLARDKWDAHKSYLHDTIVKACGLNNDVFNNGLGDKPLVPQTNTPITPAAPVSAPAQPVIKQRAADQQVMFSTEQIGHFQGCVYIERRDQIMVPGGRMLKKNQFNATYGGYLFTMDPLGEKTSNKAWEAFTESRCLVFPKVVADAFRPDLDPGVVFSENGELFVNSYFPSDIPSEPGDVSRFLGHVRKLLPYGDDAEIILSYMAAIVQYPGRKFQWCPLIIGPEGNGKTLFTRVLMQAVGPKYCHLLRPKTLAENHNGWIDRKLFVGIEDIYIPESKREIVEALKPMITGEYQGLRSMGVDEVTVRSCTNFLANSNHYDAVKKSVNDRRWCVMHCAQVDVYDVVRDGMTQQYFLDLYDWLNAGGYANVTHYLQNMEIRDIYDPTKGAQRAPETTSTNAAVSSSRGMVEQEILEAIAEERPGFAGGWISSIALGKLLDQIRRGNITHSKRIELLESIGYVRHPALKDGRTNSNTRTDYGKPRLFVAKDNTVLMNLTSPIEVLRLYDLAQSNQTEAAKVARSFSN